MENKNNQSKIENLSSLPLEQLTEEQLSDLMARLDVLKAQKNTAQHKTVQPVMQSEDAQTKVIDLSQTDDNAATKVIDLSPVDDSTADAEPAVAAAPMSASEPTHTHAPAATPKLSRVKDITASADAENAILPDPSCFDDIGEAPDDGTPYPLPETKSATDDEYNTRPLSSDDMDDATIAVYRDLVKKRRRQRRLILALASTAGVLIIFIAVIAAYLNLYKPTVDVTPPPFISNGAETDDNGDPIPGVSVVVPPFTTTDDSGNAPTINDTYERREDVYNFLVLGIDKAANLSDVIMIVSYDVKNADLSVLSLPRDTYIDVGAKYHKLNAYFSASYNRSQKRGNERYRDAIESMASFLEKGLCVKLDRYVCVDTAGFREIVNAIGGVDMEIPFDMEYDDPEQDLHINLKAGYQHLDGALAEQFVRFRSGYLNGDLGRISAQKLFLTALASQLKRNFDVSTLVAVAKTALNYVTTDLTVAEIGYFAKNALSVDMDKIHFTTLPGGGVINPDSGASYYVMYAENVRKIVNAQFNVYTREISREVFLANSTRFTNTAPYIATVFASEVADDGTVSAGDISADSIDIPTRN